MFMTHPSHVHPSAAYTERLRLSHAYLRTATATAMVVAVVPSLVCACIAQGSGNWNLFERSGYIVTAFGLWVASKHCIQPGSIQLAAMRARNRQAVRFAEVWDEIVTARLCLALSAFGMVVSGWGSYLGWWSFCFVLLWLLVAMAAPRRDAIEIRNFAPRLDGSAPAPAPHAVASDARPGELGRSQPSTESRRPSSWRDATLAANPHSRDDRCRDPGIDEIVGDPMVRAIMLADHVDPEALKTLLRSVAARPFVRHETV